MSTLAPGFVPGCCHCIMIVLAQFIIHNKSKVNKKAVLEIGAGTALPGIVAAKCGATVILSDAYRYQNCLSNARKACLANSLDETSISVASLTWGEFSSDLLEVPKIDIILGSDCFYSPEEFESILVTVSYLMEKNVDCVFWTTYQLRSSSWSLEYLLDKWDLQCTNIPLNTFGGDADNLGGHCMSERHTIKMLEIKKSASQDSLSQSILTPEATENGLEKAKEALNVIETKQANIKSMLTAGNWENLSGCESMLSDMKENLVSVNRILQNEKKLVSDLRMNYSQSQSSMDFSQSNSSQFLLKQNATILLTQQRRLLNAFKTQKVILDLWNKQRVDESTTQEQRGGKKSTGNKEDAQKITSQTSDNDQYYDNKKQKFSTIEAAPKINSFQIIDRKVQLQHSSSPSNHLPVQQPVLVRVVSANGKTWSETSGSQVMRITWPVNSSNRAVCSVNDSSTPNVNGTDASIQRTAAFTQGTAASIQGTDASIKGTDASIQGTAASIQRTAASIQGIAASIQGTPASIQRTDASIQGTATSIQSTDASIQGTDASIQRTAATFQNAVATFHSTSVLDVKRTVANTKPSTNKQPKRKRESLPKTSATDSMKSKLIKSSPHFAADQDQGTKSISKEAIAAKQKVDDRIQNQALPFLNSITPSTQKPRVIAAVDAEISKLKFVVTLKDEEFIKSSKFLPSNFWTTKAFERLTIDDEFLREVGFLS
eukprot:gene14241-15726_t